MTAPINTSVAINVLVTINTLVVMTMLVVINILNIINILVTITSMSTNISPDPWSCNTLILGIDYQKMTFNDGRFGLVNPPVLQEASEANMPHPPHSPIPNLSQTHRPQRSEPDFGCLGVGSTPGPRYHCYC